jgi:recombination protein RecT
MSDTTTAVANRPATIRDELQGDAFKRAIGQVLPKHLTPDRMARVAIMAMTKNPKLAQCDRTSFFGAMMTLSQYGLEPDGRRAHLIPYGTTCQLVIDYKGLVELAMRSGLVSNIHADVVCENDEFSYKNGEVNHEPNLRKERGAVFAVYAIAKFKDGAEKSEVMSLSEVEAIRKRSKSGTSGPWVTDWNEMAKKTVFRRLSKWLPLSPEFRDAVDADTDDGTGFQLDTSTIPDAAPVMTSAATTAPAADATPKTRKKRETVVDVQPEPATTPAAAPVPDPPADTTESIAEHGTEEPPASQQAPFEQAFPDEAGGDDSQAEDANLDPASAQGKLLLATLKAGFQWSDFHTAVIALGWAKTFPGFNDLTSFSKLPDAQAAKITPAIMERIVAKMADMTGRKAK